MSYSLTATTSNQVISSNLYDKDGTKSTLTIQNLGVNPVFFETDEAVATTASLCLPTQYSSYTCPNDGIDRVSFITTGGTSVVTLKTA